MLITYKTQNSKMHVERNEGVLNQQHFFSQQILNLNFGMYGELPENHQKCKHGCLGLP